MAKPPDQAVLERLSAKLVQLMMVAPKEVAAVEVLVDEALKYHAEKQRADRLERFRRGVT